MKLSENTITILKNFASINPSIYIRQGNIIRTIAIAGNIAASAVVEDDFDLDFAIYDVHEFLNGLRLYDSPVLDFSTPNRIIVKQDRHKIEYGLVDPALISCADDRDIKLPSVDISFTLKQVDFEKLLKASSVFTLPYFSVVGDGQTISLQVVQKDNPSSNKVSVEVGDTTQEFSMYYKIENLKIIPGDYDVSISKHLISKFKNRNFDLIYFIGLESDSVFYS
jgi:hypothetical protein